MFLLLIEVKISLIIQSSYLFSDSQMNTSIIKQVINMDPFICDTSAFTYAHYPLNMKQPFYHNIMMGEGCAI